MQPASSTRTRCRSGTSGTEPGTSTTRRTSFRTRGSTRRRTATRRTRQATPRPTGSSGGWLNADATTDLGLYGGSWVGFLGGSVSSTNVPNVLRTDLNALDFYAASSYPTYLYYNPTSDPVGVDVALAGASDLHDEVTDRVLLQNVSGTQTVTIPPGSTILVIAPSSPVRSGPQASERRTTLLPSTVQKEAK